MGCLLQIIIRSLMQSSLPSCSLWAHSDRQSGAVSGPSCASIIIGTRGLSFFLAVFVLGCTVGHHWACQTPKKERVLGK